MGNLADIAKELAAQRPESGDAIQIATPDVWAQLAALMDEPERMHALYLELVESGQITVMVKPSAED